MTLGRILGIWLMIAGILIWNGVLGIGIWNPILGRDAGEMMTAFLAIALVFGGAKPFLAPQPELPIGQVLRIAAIWLVLTVLFERGMGWLAEFGPGAMIPRYGMWDGSFWPVVVVAVAVTPISYLRRPELPLGRFVK